MTNIILISIALIVGIWIGHGIGYRYKLSMLQSHIDELMVSLCAKDATIRRYMAIISELKTDHQGIPNAQGTCTKCGG